MPDRVLYDKVQEAKKQLNRVIRGKEQVLQLLFAALFAGGHVLMDVCSGDWKDDAGKGACAFRNGGFQQDSIYAGPASRGYSGFLLLLFPRKKGLSFSVRDLFSRICFWRMRSTGRLPGTQSALLEAMNERQVSIEGKELKLIKPFLVIATQNPIEYYGTYPLPEAQS